MKQIIPIVFYLRKVKIGSKYGMNTMYVYHSWKGRITGSVMANSRDEAKVYITFKHQTKTKPVEFFR